MGIRIETIKAEATKSKKKDLDLLLKRDISLFGKFFNDKKKEHFYEELSVLLKSGINLKQALDLIEESQTKIKDRELIGRLNGSILAGNSFAGAVKLESSFTPYEYYALKIGEQTGEMAFITEDLAEFYQRKNEQKRQIVSSLTYPVIVLFTALIVVFFMLKFVVPMFVNIFDQNKVELPFLTQIVVDFSNVIQEQGWLFLLLITGGVVGVRIGRNKDWFKKLSGNFLLRIPVLGNYMRRIYIARFTHTMMLLTNSKIPILNGLSLVREMIHFQPLQASLKAIEKDILQGEKMSASFKKHAFFDKKMIALLKVAEETNQTEFVFRKLHDQYSREVEYQAKTITNILNPLLTLFVGLIVGVILIAMYLPMFRLSSVIG